MKNRFGTWLTVGSVAFYIAALVGAYYIGKAYAIKKTDALLAVSLQDVELSLCDTYDRILAFTANAIVDEIGTAKRLSFTEAHLLARKHGVNELNISDTNGVWIASTDARVVGKRLGRSANTAMFLRLFDNDQQVVFQPFRRSVANPAERRKYFGMLFDDRSGILQIGIDESRLTEDFDRIFVDYFTALSVGNSFFYIVADLVNGEITEYGDKRNKDKAAGHSLSEIGLPVDQLTGHPEKGIPAILFGESVRCMAVVTAKRRFVCVVPDRENYDIRLLIMAIPAVLLTLIFTLAGFIIRSVRRTREAEMSLRAEKLKQQQDELRRQAEDLAMARDIQRAALPSVFPPYPRDLTIDLFAMMNPAKDVGGDFYDFHYVGLGKLAVLIADVSGKGVPAAMFMMNAKTILRSYVLSINDLGEALGEVNNRLCEGNAAEMFVTCWIGVFNERTGELRYVNAGHNPPYVKSADGTLRQLTRISGMALGAWNGVKYTVHTEQLKRGDMLFLYTDGVTEANNPIGGLFGEERVEEVLRGERGAGLARFSHKASGFVSPKEYCRRMRSAVDSFAGSAAQFDDITMLVLNYRGAPVCSEKSFPATLESVPAMSAFAEAELDVSACPEAVKRDLLVALDEVANNVASYSKATEMTLTVEVAVNPSVWRMSISDDGTPWNPLEHLDPDVTLSADDREIGGLGILMVKRLMDDVSYVHADGKNIFKFRKAAS